MGKFIIAILWRVRGPSLVLFEKQEQERWLAEDVGWRTEVCGRCFWGVQVLHLRRGQQIWSEGKQKGQDLSWSCFSVATVGHNLSVNIKGNHFREVQCILKGHYHDVAHARSWLVSFIGKQWNCHFVASCRCDKVTDKRYLYPIRDSRSSLNCRKKGQLAQLVRENNLFFRAKWQKKLYWPM